MKKEKSSKINVVLEFFQFWISPTPTQFLNTPLFTNMVQVLELNKNMLLTLIVVHYEMKRHLMIGNFRQNYSENVLFYVNVTIIPKKR